MAEYSLKSSIAKVRDLLKQKPVGHKRGLEPGNAIMFKYNAKDKRNKFDKTPFIFVLRSSQSYVLGLNLHWCPYPMRLLLIKFYIKINKTNIKLGKGMDLNYRMVKPMLIKLGFAPCIRLYIRHRISSSVQLIPQEKLMDVVKLRAETFTGGIPANTLYKRARKGKL